MRFLAAFQSAAAGFIQLFIVLVVALRSGFLPASITSVAANVCLNFFFVPPVLTFTINDPENWVALAVFECSALLVSRLSDRAQEQTRSAEQHQHEVEALYQVSRDLMLLNRLENSSLQILMSLKRVFSIDALVLFDSRQGSTETLGETTAALVQATKNAYLQNLDSQELGNGIWIRVLQVGGRSFGALGLQSFTLTEPVLRALASLIAITLERAQLFDSHSRIEAEKQTEQLRTTVLDALAHEYKTPLTVVRTVTSGLLETENLSERQTELISLVDREAVRLNNLTTKLLQISRLDKADMRIRRDRISLESLLESVVDIASRSASGHSIRTNTGTDGLFIRGDRELLTMALTQFLDNAAKYSDPGSPITLTLKAEPGEAHIRVHNFGPEIPSQDRERIFGRYYRGSSSSYGAPGTGLGLWITNRIAAMHEGRAWVQSDKNNGNTFVLAVPLHLK